MELRLYRVWLWVVLLILEIFVMSFDALALSFAAFVTAGLSYVLGIDLLHREQSLIIFVVASIIALLIVRMIIAPKLQEGASPSPMSGDTIIWRTFSVERVNKRDVIRHEGMYWNMKSDDTFSTWDTVEVLSMDDNVVKVKVIEN